MIHFVEWIDRWSMGDLFHRWLTTSGGSFHLAVCADRFEVFGYALPDGGRLARHLAGAGRQQCPEADWLLRRLGEAVAAWQEIVEQTVAGRTAVDHGHGLGFALTGFRKTHSGTANDMAGDLGRSERVDFFVRIDTPNLFPLEGRHIDWQVPGNSQFAFPFGNEFPALMFPVDDLNGERDQLIHGDDSLHDS